MCLEINVIIFFLCYCWSLILSKAYIYVSSESWEHLQKRFRSYSSVWKHTRKHSFSVTFSQTQTKFSFCLLKIIGRMTSRRFLQCQDHKLHLPEHTAAYKQDHHRNHSSLFIHNDQTINHAPIFTDHGRCVGFSRFSGCSSLNPWLCFDFDFAYVLNT